jgi:glucosamine kinase
MELVLGVDAGGSGTRAVVLDGRLAGGTVVGRGSAGPGNPSAIGSAAASATFAEAVAEAMRGLDPTAVVAAGAGVAGVAHLAPTTYNLKLKALGIGCGVTVFADALTAFASVPSGGTGAVLIAGTGAVAATIDDWRVGRVTDGLGWLLGDEGSGLWIGLQGVRAAARRWSERSATPLVDLVAARSGATDCDALVKWGNLAPRNDFAALAPHICALARDGDPDARRIVGEAAAKLSETVGRLGAFDGPLVLSGGLLTSPTPVRDALLDKLDGTEYHIAGDPALGAARLAVTGQHDPA